jgi:hypothetical protein
MLCLWRWSIPAAIPRINRILCSSLTFTLESNNNLSKLPNQSKFWECIWARDFLHTIKWRIGIWFDLIRYLQHNIPKLE